MTASLETLAKGPRDKPLSKKQIQKIKNWVAADWESHDVDQDIIKLIRRLLATVDALMEAP